MAGKKQYKRSTAAKSLNPENNDNNNSIQRVVINVEAQQHKLYNNNNNNNNKTHESLEPSVLTVVLCDP